MGGFTKALFFSHRQNMNSLRIKISIMPSKRKRANHVQVQRKRPSLDVTEGGRVAPTDENVESLDDYYDNPQASNTNAQTSGPINVDTGQRSAFPILASGSNPNMDNPPLNAMDYLSRVNKEASARPSIVHVNRPAQTLPPRVVQFGGRTLKSYSDNPAPVTVPSPSSAHQPQSAPQPPTALTVDLTWHTAFLGSFAAAKAALNSAPNRPLPDRYAGPEALPQTLSKWRQFFLDPANLPIVSLVSSFPHPLLIKLLGYCQKWVSGNMSPLLARWIYALLVRLPDTLTGDEVAVLRDLAKKCILVRNNPLQPLSETTKFCLDTTVSIVAGVYSQKDLITNL